MEQRSELKYSRNDSGCCVEKRLKQGATVIIQARDDDGLALGGSKGGGEKCVDHGFVLKV